MKILLIEDNPHDAQLTIDLCQLKNCNFNVTWHSTLQEGINELGKSNFDLIILDLDLSDSHGPETFETVRQMTSLPIVILTGYDDQSFGVETIQKGAQDYIVKGTDINMLSRSLLHAIARHSRIMQKKSSKEFKQAINHLTDIIDNLNNAIELDSK